MNLIYYLTAIVLGGMHALEPGHGKTVVAAYLIGSRGTKIDAVALGLVVTLTHTSSVILLAIAAKVASTQLTLTEESLHGYLGLVAGLLILIVGLWMLIGRIRGRDPFHFHSHEHGHEHSHDQGSFNAHHHSHDHHNDHGHERHDAHDHSHGDGHSHESDHGDHHNHDHNEPHHPHHHSNDDHHHDHGNKHHEPRTHDAVHTHGHEEHGQNIAGVDAHGEKRVGLWQLFLLGVSGGLIPCPAAIAILLAAVAAGRLGEGLTYILLFSVGLAAVLIAVGLVVVGAGKIASRFLDAKKFARKISIASAAIITLIGVATLLNSLRHIV